MINLLFCVFCTCDGNTEPIPACVCVLYTLCVLKQTPVTLDTAHCYHTSTYWSFLKQERKIWAFDGFLYVSTIRVMNKFNHHCDDDGYNKNIDFLYLITIPGNNMLYPSWNKRLHWLTIFERERYSGMGRCIIWKTGENVSKKFYAKEFRIIRTWEHEEILSEA